MHPDLYDSYH